MSGVDDREAAGETAMVDETLIDAMLALSPEERLRQNDRMVRTVLLLRQSLASNQAHPDDRGL